MSGAGLGDTQGIISTGTGREDEITLSATGTGSSIISTGTDGGRERLRERRSCDAATPREPPLAAGGGLVRVLGGRLDVDNDFPTSLTQNGSATLPFASAAHLSQVKPHFSKILCARV